MLKVIIVVLFAALVISLFTSFAFIMKDRGDSVRGWNALTIRLTLAGLLMATLLYGMFSGQLGSKAPWDARYIANPAPTTAPQSTTEDKP